ncbi:hypothetical protein NJB14197_28330 [Mycobacterium montefiorense]|nr:hypothetical protein NJB14197_28330 [Mycobacterium montefiorense]GKU60229.1 hypothetical protein NJB18182_07350 [Mycobacterium montefiorense]GKU68320.1 hypothetical protein NJB18183_34660 [Mycobacterium montefiorense]
MLPGRDCGCEYHGQDAENPQYEVDNNAHRFLLPWENSFGSLLGSYWLLARVAIKSFAAQGNGI